MSETMTLEVLVPPFNSELAAAPNYSRTLEVVKSKCPTLTFHAMEVDPTNPLRVTIVIEGSTKEEYLKTLFLAMLKNRYLFTLDFDVDNRYLGVIFGKCAVYIKRVKKHFNCDITINKETGRVILSNNTMEILQKAKTFLEITKRDYPFDANHTGAMLGTKGSHLNKMNEKFPQVQISIEPGIAHLKSIDQLIQYLGSFIDRLNYSHQTFTVRRTLTIDPERSGVLLGINSYQIQKIKELVPDCYIKINGEIVAFNGTEEGVNRATKIVRWVLFSFEKRNPASIPIDPTLSTELDQILYYTDSYPFNNKFSGALVGKNHENLFKIQRMTNIFEIRVENGIALLLGTKEAIEKTKVHIAREIVRLEKYYTHGVSSPSVEVDDFDPHFFD